MLWNFISSLYYLPVGPLLNLLKAGLLSSEGVVRWWQKMARPDFSLLLLLVCTNFQFLHCSVRQGYCCESISRWKSHPGGSIDRQKAHKYCVRWQRWPDSLCNVTRPGKPRDFPCWYAWSRVGNAQKIVKLLRYGFKKAPVIYAGGSPLPMDGTLVCLLKRTLAPLPETTSRIGIDRGRPCGWYWFVDCHIARGNRWEPQTPPLRRPGTRQSAN